MVEPVRYRSDDEDSGRWLRFPFRDGDIVISTRSKSGTTWLQQICALLVFGTPKLPAPVPDLSPWVDHLIEPEEDVFALLEAQPHRRFVKTHTPLDGIVLDPRATYVVVARHPLDMAVSLYHQGDNLDRERIRALTGAPAPSAPPPARPPVRDWLLRWIERESDPRESMDSLNGVLWHLSDAWRRRDEPNVVLVHYDDLLADLDGQMRLLAGRFGIAVPEEGWDELVDAATLRSMRAGVDRIIPNRKGILKDAAAFFRRGTSGGGRELLTAEELAAYRERIARHAPADLLAWLHRDATA